MRSPLRPLVWLALAATLGSGAGIAVHHLLEPHCEGVDDPFHKGCTICTHVDLMSCELPDSPEMTPVVSCVLLASDPGRPLHNADVPLADARSPPHSC
jgi:hypothetical protein